MQLEIDTQVLSAHPDLWLLVSDLRPVSATRNPGVGQDFTNLAAAVQLRLRVAVSAQNQQAAGFTG